MFDTLQVILSIFSHIVDLENMYQIFDYVLTFDEQNEVRRQAIENLFSFFFLNSDGVHFSY